MSQTKLNNPVPNFFLASAEDFKKIPGSPIAYWLSKNEFNAFTEATIEESATVCIGMKTGDNEKFVRNWYEVNNNKIGYYFPKFRHADCSKFSWFPYLKGGEYRKWHGNYELIIHWCNDGDNIKNHVNKHGVSDSRLRPSNFDFYFCKGVNWSFITSGLFGVRIHDNGFFFDVAGSSLFSKNNSSNEFLAGYLNSKVVRRFLNALNPTLNMQIENIKSLPNPKINTIEDTKNRVLILKRISKKDWDSYETSWDFNILPLLHPDCHQPTLKSTYDKVRVHWQSMAMEMQRLEEENNRIFIEAYGLQDELTPEVPLSEITLTCNPHYRYNVNKSEEELEALLRTDTIKELVSYAVGCMMGRYSLDKPGLVYAHSGNIGFEPFAYKTFPADEDGIIPVMDQEWFPDDATNRLVKFIKTAWPPEYLDENLKFIADSLGPRTNEMPVDTIRRYISTGFFKDHLKTYKKRPIYWLFSSGKFKAFECLVYLQRYNESTLSRMRSSYVTPLQGNFSARLEYLQNELDTASATTAKRKIQKEIDLLKKKMAELKTFDDNLRHYADMRISLDLDDGVKVNYDKFGDLLAETKAITGNN
jgi:type II restriction/modification system DNA methylase subunit YeeA